MWGLGVFCWDVPNGGQTKTQTLALAVVNTWPETLMHDLSNSVNRPVVKLMTTLTFPLLAFTSYCHILFRVNC